jgi:mannose-6-phosphate isomerase-like protein (cupin superfamily)
MEPVIRRASELQERYTDERCHIAELWGVADGGASSVARARVEPGVTTERHALAGVAELYLVASGSGTVEVEGLAGGAPARVEPGDLVVIPAGRAQRIRNDGETDLVFYCLCTPPFRPDSYRPLEERS